MQRHANGLSCMGTGFALYLYAGRVSGAHEEVVIEGGVADGFQSPAQRIPIRWWERILIADGGNVQERGNTLQTAATAI